MSGQSDPHLGRRQDPGRDAPAEDGFANPPDWTHARFDVRNGGADELDEAPRGAGAVNRSGGGDAWPNSDRDARYRGSLRTGEQLESRIGLVDASALLLVVALVVLLVWAVLQSRRLPAPFEKTPAAPDTVVWIDGQTGLYFCQGSKQYGKGRGKHLKQREAQREAYRPALGAVCR